MKVPFTSAKPNEIHLPKRPDGTFVLMAAAEMDKLGKFNPQLPPDEESPALKRKGNQ